MAKRTTVSEPLIFEGTMDQLEQAGDYVILLSYLRSRRIGRILGPLVTLFLGCAALLQYRADNLTRTVIYVILAVLVGAAVLRKTTGEEPVQAVSTNRASREKAQASGSYDGSRPFRIELSQGECRVYLDGQLAQLFDCRKFRTALECDEIIWVTGKKLVGLPLPKALLTKGSLEDLHRWLKPYAAIWLNYKIPDKLKEGIGA